MCRTIFARLADGSAVVIDVRPDELVGADDAEVFAATQRACAAVGWGYRRVGVADAVLAANVRWLSGFRHRRCGNAPAGSELVRARGGRAGDGERSGWVCR